MSKVVGAALGLAAVLGLGAAAACLAASLARALPSARLAARLRSLRPASAPARPKKRERPRSPFRDLKVTGACLGGALGFGALAWGTPYLPIAAAFGSLAGFAAVLAARRLRQGGDRFLRLREAAVLYESVDLFGRAGFTVRQAMQMSLPLVGRLRPALERCVERWGQGSLRAIEEFGREIGVPEAEVLTAVLMHAEEVGTARLAGVMEEEATRIEELRRALAEVRVASRPVYATVYVFLPVATLLGMILGPLAYRAVQMIQSMRAPGGP